ncbi:MAG: M18 family aminopeptidase [Clostridia bacterium]|nr:M18 family aminopeptidase [Clostridia bacterium]
MDINCNLINFLNGCHSQYHAIDSIMKILDKNGFLQVQPNDNLTPGGKYYITRNYSSIIAFVLPQTTPDGFLVSASHSDSPTFKVKNNAELSVEDKYVRLNTERYGGMLCAPWLDRPLTVAGKILVSCDDGIKTVLVHVDKDLLIIPNVAIHMNRNANTGFEYKANQDMLPLFGGKDSKGSFMKIVAEAAGVNEDDIIGTDLYLCLREGGKVLGANGEFIASARLDDLECAYTSLEAFTSAMTPESHALIYMVADNEEIGSDTKQGAGSTMLRDVLAMIKNAYGMNDTSIANALEQSFMLSCDNAHALHPNHTEYADPSDRPVLNGGVVIKYGVRYATDSVSEAMFRQICKLADVPVQTYSNRSDMAGGSTLGNISNTKVSLNTVDIGIAQLAMHSCYELVGAHDTCAMMNAIQAFYNCDIKHNGNGNYSITVRK